MKYVKYLWPIVLLFAAILVCVNEWNKSASTDAGGVIVFSIVAYFVILPVCCFLSSIWYGFILRGQAKWLIFPITIIPGIVILILCADIFSLGSLLFIVPSVVVAAIGTLIGSMLWRLREGRKQRNE